MESGTFTVSRGPAAQKRHDKFVQIAKQVRKSSPGHRFFVLTSSGALFGTFLEFSGEGGAKAALDRSALPVGSCVVRAADGEELAYKSHVYTM